MKKQYIKPNISFDCFKLSESISAGCELLGSNSAQYVCPVLDEESGWTIFTNQCEYGPPNGNDSICYHVPFANSNVFLS